MHQFLAALLAVLLWPSVVAAQWPAVNTDIAKGLATVFGTGTAHTYYAQGYGTCTWTVAGDIGPCTNTAIAAAVAAGGGTVVVPAGILGLATTITVPSNVVLLGAGGGGNFLSCGTTLKWNGATSPTATMVSLGSDAAFANGTGFADLCLDGDLKAGIALKALSLMKGYIGRIFIYNPTAHGMLFDISPNSGGTPEQGSFAYSSIEDVLITINSGAANGLTIAKNNVTNSDVHENWFKNIRINATNGYAFECYGADTNTFSQFRFYANPGVSYTPPGGSAASIGSIMHAGDYAGDAYATPGPGVNKLKNWCRRNMFHDVVFGLLQMGRLRMETGRNPSSAIIDGWKAGDGEPFPIVDDGTTARVTGNVTAGSAVVTGMSSTGGLLPGMLVYAPPGLVGTTQPGPGQILKLLTTIASVDSASQVTLTIPAYASATGLALTFEMRDAQIYGGLETTGVAIPGHAAFIKIVPRRRSRSISAAQKHST